MSFERAVAMLYRTYTCWVPYVWKKHLCSKTGIISSLHAGVIVLGVFFALFPLIVGYVAFAKIMPVVYVMFLATVYSVWAVHGIAVILVKNLHLLMQALDEKVQQCEPKHKRKSNGSMDRPVDDQYYDDEKAKYFR